MAFVIAFSLFAHGCASKEVLFPTGEDREHLARAIADRGQGVGPAVEPLSGPEPKSAASPAEKAMLAVAQPIAGVCMAGIFFAPLFALAALDHGNLSGLHPDFSQPLN